MSEVTRIRPRRQSTAVDPKAVTVIEPTGSLAARLLKMVDQYMADPASNAEKLDRLIGIQRDIIADHRREEFHDAMNATQGEMQAVIRNAVNPESRNKYATLEAVDAAVRPIYAKHGFSLSFTETPNDAPEIRITCIVRRRGHEETYFLSALSDMTGPKGSPNKTQVQGVGSSVSYLRRYLTCMIFNVALRDDNDGVRMRGGAAEQKDGELASKAQAAELYALLGECSARPAAEAERHFLVKMGLDHLPSLKHVPAVDVARVRNALVSKRARLREAAAGVGK